MCNSHGDSQGKSHGDLASKGRHGDTELAHVNPTEKAMLEDMGGAGTINPKTGLKEYHWYHSHNSPIKIPKKITPPKIVVKDLPDIKKQINDAYQGSDIDKTLEDTEDMASFISDSASSVLAGKPVGKLKETEKDLTATGEVLSKIPKNLQDTFNEVVGIGVSSLDNVTKLSTSLSKQINRNLKTAGMLPSDYDDTKEDPTLAGRRRGKRRGNEKDVRGGALRIPSSSVGIQIPS